MHEWSTQGSDQLQDQIDQSLATHCSKRRSICGM